jgi:uncharacterized protein
MRVTALYFYPVKACRAIEVEDAALGPLGVEHDRRFAFVGDDGCALTQREHPLLATIRPQLDDGALRLDFGGLVEAAFSLEDFRQETMIDVWGKRIPARRHASAGAEEYLGVPSRLVLLDGAAQRSFADSRPVLVASTLMLARLGVGMERFRPNVVVDGAESWSALEGKAVRLERDKACGRCEVTTIDQTSGERRGPEPLRTLNERFEGNFGVYCRVARPGRVRRGETLQAA